MPPVAEGQVRVVDLILADLSSQRGLIKNVSRIIRLCSILAWLQQVIGEGKDGEMFVQFWWTYFYLVLY